MEHQENKEEKIVVIENIKFFSLPISNYWAINKDGKWIFPELKQIPQGKSVKMTLEWSE